MLIVPGGGVGKEKGPREPVYKGLMKTGANIIDLTASNNLILFGMGNVIVTGKHNITCPSQLGSESSACGVMEGGTEGEEIV